MKLKIANKQLMENNEPFQIEVKRDDKNGWCLSL